MKPGLFTEISGVCTHPDYRGKGYAAGLMRRKWGATSWQEARHHSFTPSLTMLVQFALYQRLGFVTRWQPWLMVLARFLRDWGLQRQSAGIH